MLHPRARTMLLLSTPALIIGIASSLVLIVVMKVASVLQQFLWERLPVSIGIAQDSPVWIIGMLTLTGIMVGLVIRYSQGHAGPDPACEPLIGIPVPTSAIPGLLAALDKTRQPVEERRQPRLDTVDVEGGDLHAADASRPARRPQAGGRGAKRWISRAKL